MKDAAPLRIRWINPIGLPVYDQPIADWIRSIKRPGVEVEVVSFAMKGSPNHLEYQTYEGLVTGNIVRVTRDAAVNGFDAVVIGCFYDVGLEEAREISGPAVVVVPCLASVQAVVNLAGRFSVIVGRTKWIDQMERNILRYGYGSYLASMRAVGMRVEEFHKEPEKARRLLTEAGRKAVEEDHAEALILGCTIEAGFYKELQEELRVPVIDAVVAPYKMAELAAELKRLAGWSPSRVWGGEPPPEKELAEWGVFAEPAPIGNRILIPPGKVSGQEERA